MNYTYAQLHSSDLTQFHDLSELFGTVFADPRSYQESISRREYLERFLKDDSHIVLVALGEKQSVVGGLVAYELQKFEQERSEIFIYDLAVAIQHQRKGIATGLLQMLKRIAKEHGAYVLFVQADKIDAGAIALYRTLASEEIETYNFDITV